MTFNALKEEGIRKVVGSWLVLTLDHVKIELWPQKEDTLGSEGRREHAYEEPAHLCTL